MTHAHVAIGIDLGTTYSAIAHVNDGEPELIPNREGERVTPSVLLFDGPTPIVGALAAQAIEDQPLKVVQFVKRYMGDPNWRFAADDGREYTPEEASALILKRLREDAEAALGRSVDEAVISVPAYFNDAQRKATHDAGRIAGLNVLRVLNEPTAAALAYGIGQNGESQTILVFDLGGGTFDVTILRIDDRDITVCASGGDRNLGGFDWDNALMVHLDEEFRRAGGTSLLDDPQLTNSLRQRSELAKRTLSQRDSALVRLTDGRLSQSFEITRERMAALTKDLLSRAQAVMEFVLEDAALQWSDLTKILLVGGSTRMPAVREMIAQVSGISPSSELHPDEVVALGAAVQASLLAQESQTALVPVPVLHPVVVSDVTSHSLGVVAVEANGSNPYNSIIIPRNTPIPAQKAKLYQTVQDGQTEIDVDVVQGEEHALEFAHVIGRGTMKLPPYPRGAPIEVVIGYDDNAVIHVHVFDRTSDTMLGEMKIERQSNLTEAEVEVLTRRVGQTSIS